MTQLTRFDTNSLAQLNRALIGFDRIFGDMERRFSKQVTNNYPPFNITKVAENLYDIDIAVAGFDKSEISVEVEGDQLTVRGEKSVTEDPSPEYLHRGLALRDFELDFTLTDHTEVARAEIKNGLLSIRLERKIPDALLPRRINIEEIK